MSVVKHPMPGYVIVTYGKPGDDGELIKDYKKIACIKVSDKLLKHEKKLHKHLTKHPQSKLKF